MIPVVEKPGTIGLITTLAAGGDHFFGADDLVERIVAAFNQYIRLLRPLIRLRGVSSSKRITASTMSREAMTVARASWLVDGALFAFQTAGGGIRIKADDEDVGFAGCIG